MVKRKELVEKMKRILKIVGVIMGVITAVFSILFGIYFFNLDMKLTVNVIAPLLEKVYDRRERDNYL
ncbi:MAG: hypothetical protein MJ117_05580 [Lachnospiraceae bacterium]|nr:hypothetical protein [Lachnospiraceae bacterium]